MITSLEAEQYRDAAHYWQEKWATEAERVTSLQILLKQTLLRAKIAEAQLAKIEQLIEKILAKPPYARSVATLSVSPIPNSDLLLDGVPRQEH